MGATFDKEAVVADFGGISVTFGIKGPLSIFNGFGWDDVATGLRTTVEEVGGVGDGGVEERLR